MYLLPYLPAVVSTYPLRYPGGCPPTFLSTLFGHIPSNDLHIPFNTLRAPAGRPPFCMLCFLCQDSLRGQSLMNLDWCFVVVRPQRQTFVRLLLQLQNRTLLRAEVRRPAIRPINCCHKKAKGVINSPPAAIEEIATTCTSSCISCCLFMK